MGAITGKICIITLRVDYYKSALLGLKTGLVSFNVIQFIKEYEEGNFGEVYTDFSDPEKVVNIYVYILREEIVERWKHRREEGLALIHEWA